MDESVEFLEEHIEDSFGAIMEEFIIENLYWLEQGDHARAVAEMYMLEDGAHNRNLVCLFPPFYPNKLDNK
jgi:hypothetical protein